MDVGGLAQVDKFGRTSAAQYPQGEPCRMTESSVIIATPPTHALWHRAGPQAKWRKLFIGTADQCADEFHRLVTDGKMFGDWLTTIVGNDPNVKSRAA